jgi:hypothetical protein
MKRLYFISTILTFYILGYSQTNNRLKYYGNALAMTSFSILCVYVVAPNIIDLLRVAKFLDIFYFGTDITAVSDDSLLARFDEISFALSQTSKTLFFGNGALRSQHFNGLFKDVYFYVSDIGIFGIFFTSGVTGILIWIRQLKWVRNKLRESGQLSNFRLSILGYLSVLSLMSFGTGGIFHEPTIFLFLVMLMLKRDQVVQGKSLPKSIN